MKNGFDILRKSNVLPQTNAKNCDDFQESSIMALPPKTQYETKTREFTVTNRNGIHARPASMIVRLANKFFDVELHAEKDGEDVNAKSIMGLMLLAAGNGSCVKFHATGEKSGELLDALAELFKRKFDEV
jgi:phosphocarrier protein